MTFILFAAILPASAYEIAANCDEYMYASLPFTEASDVLPPDASLPIILNTECRASGDVDVRLHRMVNGIPAEAIVSQNLSLDPDSQQLVVLTPPEPLLNDADYAVVTLYLQEENVYAFSTGNIAATGMDDGVPEIEIIDIVAYEYANGSYDIMIDTNIIPVNDPDSVSVLQIYNVNTDAAVLTRFAPETLTDQRLLIPSSEPGEQCLFITQTDALGFLSGPSAIACGTPEVIEYSEGLCSTAGASPALFSSLIAMLFGMRRRNF